MALRQSVGGLATTLVSIVRTRLELFALEASEQKSHLASVIGLVLGAALCCTLALLVFSVAVALYFWPTDQRYLALFMLALIYAVIGVGLFAFVRHKLVQASLPFAVTLDELRHDVELLERLQSDNPSSQAGTRPAEPL